MIGRIAFPMEHTIEHYARRMIGLIVVILICMPGVRIVPLIMAYRSTNDTPPLDVEDIERQDEYHEG